MDQAAHAVDGKQQLNSVLLGVPYFLVFSGKGGVARVFGCIDVLVGLAPEIPEDLYMLIKKAVAVRKHLDKNRQDRDSKFRLILIESRIHRLARYYRMNRKLSPNWKYESSTASALVA